MLQLLNSPVHGFTLSWPGGRPCRSLRLDRSLALDGPRAAASSSSARRLALSIRTGLVPVLKCDDALELGSRQEGANCQWRQLRLREFQGLSFITSFGSLASLPAECKTTTNIPGAML